MPQKLWIPGEEVVADDINDYLQNQVVPQFASTAERDAQWASPPEGALCVTDDNLYQVVEGIWWTPFARVSYVEVTTSPSAASAETVIATAPAVTLPASRYIRVEARWRAILGGSGEACQLRIREGTTTAGTQLGDLVQNMGSAGAQNGSASGGTFAIHYTPAAGSKQWVLTSQSTTANTVQVLASSSPKSAISLAVVDEGAA